MSGQPAMLSGGSWNPWMLRTCSWATFDPLPQGERDESHVATSAVWHLQYMFCNAMVIGRLGVRYQPHELVYRYCDAYRK